MWLGHCAPTSGNPSPTPVLPTRVSNCPRLNGSTLRGRKTPLPPSPLFFPAWQGLQEESLDLWAQVEATKPLIQGNPQHQQLMDQLCIDCQALQRSLDVSAGLSCHLAPLAVEPHACPSLSPAATVCSCAPHVIYPFRTEDGEQEYAVQTLRRVDMGSKRPARSGLS